MGVSSLSYWTCAGRASQSQETPVPGSALPWAHCDCGQVPPLWAQCPSPYNEGSPRSLCRLIFWGSLFPMAIVGGEASKEQV